MPVLVQCPVWEASFPDCGRVDAPGRGPRDGNDEARADLAPRGAVAPARRTRRGASGRSTLFRAVRPRPRDRLLERPWRGARVVPHLVGAAALGAEARRVRLVVALLALGALVVVPAVGAPCRTGRRSRRARRSSATRSRRRSTSSSTRVPSIRHVFACTRISGRTSAAPQRVTRRAAGGARPRAVRLPAHLPRPAVPARTGPSGRSSFAPVRVTAGTQTQTLRWPNLRVASRVDPHELCAARLRAPTSCASRP